MVKKNRIVVVMPAYNAAKTIEKTVRDIPKGLVSEIIVVDDHSGDDTIVRARKLGLTVFSHPQNLGYGGNQKTCYWEALKKNPNVIVLLHPDYQYDATLLPELVRPILEGRYDFMFGNRIHSREGALSGGMPFHKYFFNRLFTLLANTVTGMNYPEYFSGLRAYSAKTLRLVPFQRFSNDFVFDQQFTFSAASCGLRIGSIPISTRYYSDSSSIQLRNGLKFGLESIQVLLVFLLNRFGLIHSPLLKQIKS